MAALAVTSGVALTLAVPGASSGATSGAGWLGTGVVLPPNAVSASASAGMATACPAPGNCIVLGVYQNTAGHGSIFADTEAAGSWTATQVPLPTGAPANANPLPHLLECAAVGSCTAVGQYTDASVKVTFAATLSGGTWTDTVVAMPPGAATNPDSSVYSLACPSALSCIFAGSYHTPTKQEGLLATDTGGVWTATSAPLPVNADTTPHADVTSVSCPAVGDCVGVGVYHSTTSGNVGLIETLDGATWTPAPAPMPPGGETGTSFGLISISCPAPGNCTAVGAFKDGAGRTASLVLTDVNGTLSATAGPVPTNAATGSHAGSVFFGISCPTTSWCAATGLYANGAANTGAGYLAELTGGTWKATEAPGLPTTTTSLLTSISCSWPGACAAAGFYFAAVTKPVGAIETLVNGTWSEQSAVLPPGSTPGVGSLFGSPESYGGAVSCVAGSCAAIGTSGFTTTSGERGFIDTYPGLDGYQEVASDGGLFAFGTPFFGSMGGQPLNEPIVAMAVKPDNGGYYEVASDGGIFAFGAPFHGSMGGKPLNEPIVGIAFDTITGGYYEVASDGGIFAFTAPFHGSMGGKPLNAPIVGIAFDPDTGGYYEVASDGGIFAFTAPFHGSMGGKALNKPIVGITVDSATGGYYEVASDGGLFAFTAPFHGSMGGQPLNEPIVGMAYDYVTGGYYEVASDGGLFAFTAPFNGSMGGMPLNRPVVGIAFG
jgi:hypothetical protein